MRLALGMCEQSERLFLHVESNHKNSSIFTKTGLISVILGPPH